MPLHLFFVTECSPETKFNLRHLDWADVVTRKLTWKRMEKDKLWTSRKLPWLIYAEHGNAYGAWVAAVAGVETKYDKGPDHYSMITFLRYQRPVVEIAMLVTSGYSREGYSLVPPRWFDKNPRKPWPPPRMMTAYDILLGDE